MSESSAINGRKQVFYLNVSQMAADLTAYLTHLPPVIVVGVLEICQGKHSAYHLLDLVIDSADDEETAAERIYHEYQHIQ